MQWAWNIDPKDDYWNARGNDRYAAGVRYVNSHQWPLGSAERHAIHLEQDSNKGEDNEGGKNRHNQCVAVTQTCG